MTNNMIPVSANGAQLARIPEPHGSLTVGRSDDPREMLVPRSISDVGVLAKIFSGSGMYAAEGKPLSIDQVAVIILTGIDLGLTPSQALRGIKVIKGQPAPSADTLIACCRRRTDVCEFIQVLRSNSEIVEMAGKRVGDMQPTVAQFTIDDARTAGLTASAMYTKYSEQMLYARCAVKLVRRVWPDIALGMYTDDELRGGARNEEEADMAPVSAPLRRMEPYGSTPAPDVTPAELSEKDDIVNRTVNFLDAIDEAYRSYVLGYMDHMGWTGKIQDLTLEQLREYDAWIAEAGAKRAADQKQRDAELAASDNAIVVTEVTEAKDDKAGSDFLKAEQAKLVGRIRTLTLEDKENLRKYMVAAFNGAALPRLLDIFQIEKCNKALDDLKEDPFTDLVSLVPKKAEGAGHGA